MLNRRQEQVDGVYLAKDAATAQWETSAVTPIDLGAADLTVQQISEGWLQLTKQPAAREGE